jgi:hypothetical protein
MVSLTFSNCFCPTRTAAVVKHFDDFHEDQFDFHSYCVRKVTLRAYTDVLKFEDNLWGEDYYFTAAEGTTRIYLHLFDNPEITKEDEEPDYSKMNAKQRKKAKAIARKKRAKAEKEEEAAKKKQQQQAAENGDQKNAQKKGAKPSFIDQDPYGKELLKADPLEEAKKYSAILSKHCPKRIGTWALQYDVAIRRKKVMLALQALLRLKSHDAGSADYVSRMIDFVVKIPTFDMAGAVKNVVTEECSKLLNGVSVANVVTELAQKARSDSSTPLPLRIVIAKSLVNTKSEPVDKAVSVIVDAGSDMRGFDIESCRLALTTLKDFGSEASLAVEKWKLLVNKQYPLAKNFS